MTILVVDNERCKGCGLCVSDCPTQIIATSDDGPPRIASERESDCILCQHCLAICPEGAVSIHGHVPEESRPLLPGALPSLEQVDLFVRGRRSVRQYRRENVDPALVERLLDALACGPTGVNVRELTFTLIRDRAVLDDLRERIARALAEALKTGRLSGKAAAFATAICTAHGQGRDVVFRGAPHLLVVSAPASTPCPQEDVPLTLATFEFLAQSAGLGTLWCGYLHRILEALPELKGLVGLPADHVYYGMPFGHPAIRYARTVERKGSAKIRRLEGLPLT